MVHATFLLQVETFFSCHQATFSPAWQRTLSNVPASPCPTACPTGHNRFPLGLYRINAFIFNDFKCPSRNHINFFTVSKEGSNSRNKALQRLFQFSA
jgi:hypothetical protein